MYQQFIGVVEEHSILGPTDCQAGGLQPRRRFVRFVVIYGQTEMLDMRFLRRKEGNEVAAADLEKASSRGLTDDPGTEEPNVEVA